MSAYVVVQVTIHDPEKYEGYKALTPETIQNHGGRFLVRGGELDIVEGEWGYQRMVVLEFDTMEQAKGWYSSPEYQEALKIRHSASEGLVIIADGCA
jgi:uncharacterized protein (DUF1330 family)